MSQGKNTNTKSKRRALCRLFGKAAVSVIVPVYNSEKDLKTCLDSILEQDFTDFELLCINDGSTDSSPEILAEYERLDSRVKVINQENKGCGASRNIGIDKAKGKYIIFLDSDDFFEKDMLSKLYEKAEQTEADIVLFAYRTYNTKSGEESEKQGLNTDIIGGKDVFSRRDLPDTFMDITKPNVWTKFYRRGFITENGLEFQPIPNAEDVYFTYAALCLAERISFVDEAFAHYRIGREDSLEHNKHLHPLCFIEAEKALFDELNKRGIYDEVKISNINRAVSHCAYVIWKFRDMPEIKETVKQRLSDDLIPYVALLDLNEENYRNKEHYNVIKSIYN